jgi:hypothetical protein
MKKIIYTLLLFNFFFLAKAQKKTTYIKSINDWHKERISDLKTADGWLAIRIPNERISDAILQLRKTQGKQAKISAGNGVTIILELA